jgi:hypothetical protein
MLNDEMRVRFGNGRMEWNAMERIFDAEEEKYERTKRTDA